MERFRRCLAMVSISRERNDADDDDGGGGWRRNHSPADGKVVD